MNRRRENREENTLSDEIRTWGFYGFLAIVLFVVVLCFCPDLVEISRRLIHPVYRVVGWMVFFGVFGVALLRFKR